MLLKVLNPILALLVINQVTTGLLGDKMSLEAFETFHESAGIVLAAAVALHLVLNAGWIRTSYLKRKTKGASE
jgi:hypothetical protein